MGKPNKKSAVKKKDLSNNPVKKLDNNGLENGGKSVKETKDVSVGATFSPKFIKDLKINFENLTLSPREGLEINNADSNKDVSNITRCNIKSQMQLSPEAEKRTELSKAILENLPKSRYDEMQHRKFIEQQLVHEMNLAKLGKPSPGNNLQLDRNITGAETAIGKATEKANQELLIKARTMNLNCDDVAKHTAFLAEQRQLLKEYMEGLHKKMRIHHSLLKQNSRNVGKHLKVIDTLEKQIQNGKRDSIRFNLILDQFLSSPAYATMLRSFEKVAKDKKPKEKFDYDSDDSIVEVNEKSDKYNYLLEFEDKEENISFEDVLKEEKARMKNQEGVKI